MVKRRSILWLVSALIVPLFILGWGVMFTYGAVQTYAEVSRLARYVQTTGTVRATDVQLQGGYAGGTHRGGGTPASFTPVVWYDYTVGGRAFTGNRMYLTPIHTQSLAEAQGWIAHTPAGSSLAVWYDPANPEDAVLSTAFTTQNPLWLAIMPVFTLGFGSIMAIVMVRRLRSKPAVAPTAP